MTIAEKYSKTRLARVVDKIQSWRQRIILNGWERAIKKLNAELEGNVDEQRQELIKRIINIRGIITIEDDQLKKIITDDDIREMSLDELTQLQHSILDNAKRLIGAPDEE